MSKTNFCCWNCGIWSEKLVPHLSKASPSATEECPHASRIIFMPIFLCLHLWRSQSSFQRRKVYISFLALEVIMRWMPGSLPRHFKDEIQGPFPPHFRSQPSQATLHPQTMCVGPHCTPNIGANYGYCYSQMRMEKPRGCSHDVFPTSSPSWRQISSAKWGRYLRMWNCLRWTLSVWLKVGRLMEGNTEMAEHILVIPFSRVNLLEVASTMKKLILLYIHKHAFEMLMHHWVLLFGPRSPLQHQSAMVPVPQYLWPHCWIRSCPLLHTLDIGHSFLTAMPLEITASQYSLSIDEVNEANGTCDLSEISKRMGIGGKEILLIQIWELSHFNWAENWKWRHVPGATGGERLALICRRKYTRIANSQLRKYCLELDVLWEPSHRAMTHWQE
jgi:hypothetical protein